MNRFAQGCAPFALGALMLVALGCMAPLSAFAQGWEELVPLAPGVIDAAWSMCQSILDVFGVDCCPVAVCGGTLWIVTFEDGYSISNVTRHCRDVNDIMTALHGHADCDWRGPSGEGVCLNSPWNAMQLYNAHGRIVDISAAAD